MSSRQSASVAKIALGIVVSCAGNSEGAKKAWEKRRRGGGADRKQTTIPPGGRAIEYGESGKRLVLPAPSDPSFKKSFEKALNTAKKLETSAPDAAAELYTALGLPRRALKINQRNASSGLRSLRGESRAAREAKRGANE